MEVNYKIKEKYKHLVTGKSKELETFKKLDSNVYAYREHALICDFTDEMMEKVEKRIGIENYTMTTDKTSLHTIHYIIEFDSRSNKIINDSSQFEKMVNGELVEKKEYDNPTFKDFKDELNANSLTLGGTTKRIEDNEYLSDDTKDFLLKRGIHSPGNQSIFSHCSSNQSMYIKDQMIEMFNEWISTNDCTSTCSTDIFLSQKSFREYLNSK